MMGYYSLKRGRVDSVTAAVCYSACIMTHPYTPLKRGIAQGHASFEHPGCKPIAMEKAIAIFSAFYQLKI